MVVEEPIAEKAAVVMVVPAATSVAKAPVMAPTLVLVAIPLAIAVTPARAKALAKAATTPVVAKAPGLVLIPDLVLIQTRDYPAIPAMAMEAIQQSMAHRLSPISPIKIPSINCDPSRSSKHPKTTVSMQP